MNTAAPDLSAVGDTRCLLVADGAYAGLGAALAGLRPGATVLPVADATTLAVAGPAVLAGLAAAGVAVRAPLVLGPGRIHAAWEHLAPIEAALAEPAAIPLGIGSGTICDLVKLAAHHRGRPCAVAATAASMDGYAASGASILRDGAKSTFPCPAPLAIAAEPAVLAAAPPRLAAAGYADLLAKVVAGADWILADALGIEAVHPAAWALAQGGLRGWTAAPERIAAGEPAACAGLLDGLVRSGLAMQAAGTSRPASGAEHQFSHLWDMEGGGLAHPHGFKVGIGTLASARLYERILAAGVACDPEARSAAWPAWPELAAELRRRHGHSAALATALAESRAKHPEPAELAARLRRLAAIWPELAPRLRAQLLPAAELRRRLAAVGAPVAPEGVGVAAEGLAAAELRARSIRRRYTVLDLAAELGVLPA